MVQVSNASIINSAVKSLAQNLVMDWASWDRNTLWWWLKALVKLAAAASSWKMAAWLWAKFYS